MIDESCGEDFKRESKRVGVRTRVMDSLQLNVTGFLGQRSPAGKISTLGIILRYSIDTTHSTKRRTPVEVDKLVDKWIAAIVGMCSSHDKDGYDAHDAMADELLTPLLAAPVKQLREFYHDLHAKMKADTRIPFLVWISFEAWGEAVIKNAPDEGVRRLKHKLAADIAELVEGPAAEQLPEAIKRALCWRDVETLKEVKAALEDGAKPKIVGRQSCLFLECKPRGKNKKPISVMI